MKKVLFTVAATAVISTAYGAAAEAGSHTVDSGDSLWSIAKKYSTSVNKVKEWNGLTSDVIYPKQVLKINNPEKEKPAPPPVQEVILLPAIDKKYTVASGDTLIGIANKHSITLAELKALNNLNGHLIYPGQKLNVGKGSIQAPPAAVPSSGPPPVSAAPSTPAPPKADSAEKTYTIQSGDTLSVIARSYGISVSQLKEWNGLKSDMIFIGQKLKVKADSTPAASPPAKEKVFDAAKLIQEAKSHIGKPYVWGGSTADGFDCSGFIHYVYNEAGLKMSRTSSGGYYNRAYYINQPVAGDLVFFENTYKKGISHLGIYLGGSQFLHASDDGVMISSLDSSYWKKHFDGFKRFY
ncbi:LysM peptidoglycan-binding domain-containing protein [Rossellomorea vietnamensis]|uniref:LysM peptidoglycan-binding domain-containing protein n=1 Tax=Rossellomorea vietnamensis TaxID=218284 RepID=A0A5D4K9J6_9BACI|nr:LysM peptidoglycan-binding domain-containing protein [Rossellomorea vietnamensis]TYR73425.1 LysM peptidoglycan-binding domain-containing protein [Rossellomorea vietnamensis]